MKVKELFADALKFDHDFLAYSLYWSIKNGICQPEDEKGSINLDIVNFEEVRGMMERNELGVQSIKLYSMQTTPGYVLLVLAESEQSARSEYLNEIGILPVSIVDMSDRMDMSFWIEEISNYKSVRVMKDEAIIFPMSLFEYEKTSRDLSPQMKSLLYV